MSRDAKFIRQPCHGHVTAMQEPWPVRIYDHVTALSQSCHDSLTDVSRLFQGHVRALSSPCHGHITTMSRTCHARVTTMSQRCHVHPSQQEAKHSSVAITLVNQRTSSTLYTVHCTQSLAYSGVHEALQKDLTRIFSQDL